MTKTLIIGLGGFVGAIARYGLSGFVHRFWNSTVPIGTLAVNITGCLLIGAFLYLVEDRPFLSPHTRLFLSIGLLGAFTTFSTLRYETIEMLQNRETEMAVLNVLGNVTLGIGAVWVGRTIFKTIGV